MATVTIYNRIQGWAFAQTTAKSRFQTLGRMAVRILLILLHVFFKTNISLRASALTFSIILSLVPMLAMSTAILKGLGSDNELKIAAYRLIDQIDTAATRQNNPHNKPPQINADAQSMDNKMDEAPATMTTHLRNGVDMIFDYVDRTNFAALGAFGIVGLLFVVLLMFNEIEMTMNVIWHSRESRPVGRKIMDYLALLILLPISLNTAFAGNAILQSKKMMGYITTVIPSEWLVQMLFKGLPFLFIVGSLTFMYQFFPYAKVKTHAAFIGAFFASICWFAVLQLYIALQIGVSQYNAIYGSFATVPLFLIWLHLGWMFLLLGAALAYAVQNRDSYHPFTGNKETPKHRLQLAYDILKTVYTNFVHHQPTTIADLVCAFPEEPISQVTNLSETLLKKGLLYKVAGNDGLTMTPAQPPDQLKAEDILTLILGEDTKPTEGGRFAEAIITAAKSGAPHPLFTIDDSGDTHASGQ
ncbi:MAG TPA: YihY/virulence factor BrkB family protein [Desulfobulbaceae bacterium]|nr:YihY/virulence factor BrkB family protein [Desulfobulbaceae bacterium]